MMAVLIGSLSFHEAAHAFTAHRLGDTTARDLGRLTLNPIAHIDWIGTVLFPLLALYSGIPLIGWAKPVPVDMRNLRNPRRDFAIVALAGPISNLILAVGAALLFEALVGTGSYDNLTGRLLLMAVILNVLLAVFNMIPIPPLDGGNVLMGVAPLPVARAIDWIRPYGFVLLYALVLTDVLWAIVRPVQNFLLSFLL